MVGALDHADRRLDREDLLPVDRQNLIEPGNVRACANPAQGGQTTFRLPSSFGMGVCRHQIGILERHALQALCIM
jgi:hypothetical protein